MFVMLVGMKKLSTNASQWVNRCADVLFPPLCLFCKQPLHSNATQSSATQDSGLCCMDCFQGVRVWPHHLCLGCGTVLPEAMVPGPCGACLTHPPAQQQTHSLYEYHGPVRDALLEWKLQGHDAAVRWLLKAAMPSLSGMIDRDALLLPVPMPLSRMRKHGQHHAANMCRWLADDLGCAWDWSMLRRIGEQARQSSLSGSARRKNLRKAFALAADYKPRWQGIMPEPRSVWIVDDILTTGSTLHFAAKASLRLGVAVNVLSLARTSSRG